MPITIKVSGRRCYIVGNTFQFKDRIKQAGGHWDADRKQWWISNKEICEQLVAELAKGPPSASHLTQDRMIVGDNAVVYGRAECKGQRCYLAGRVVRGRTHWDDKVAPVESTRGLLMLLYSLDGQRRWWADANGVTVTKRYGRPQTIGGLKSFAEGVRSGRVAVCSYCGSPSCEGARGGLCEQD